MEKGYSSDTSMIFRFLGAEKTEEVEMFANDMQQEEYYELTTPEEVDSTFGETVLDYIKNNVRSDIEILKSYTSYIYKEINAIMRNNWNYEENGRLTPELRREYEQKGEKMINLIRKFPSLNQNIRVYRGTSLRQFREYGITNLSELHAMVGKYIYDPSFSSTSLLRNKSLLGMKNFFTGDRNIEIEYLIPASCQDGAILLDSYSPEESEYLINAGNLSKVTKVVVDEANNKAYVQAILIPKMLWDPYQIEEEIEMKK